MVEDAGFPVTYTFTVSDDLGDSVAAQGTLSVLESRPIICDTPPDAPTDGGGVAPGCPGDELSEIGTATLTGGD